MSQSGSPREEQTFIVQLGAAMSASGQPVDIVQRRLQKVAAAYGRPSVRVSAFPTSLMVTMGAGEPATLELTTQQGIGLRLDQIALVDRLSRDAMTGTVAPADGLRRLDEIRSLSRRFHPVATVVGNGLLALGVCLVLKPPRGDLIPAAVFGLLVGCLQLAGRRQPASFHVLSPVFAAYLVAVLSGIGERTGIAEPGIRAIVASLVVFLPGAALTTAVLELGAGDMVSGSSRLAYGAVALALLAFGILAGVETAGVTATAVFASSNAELGAWAPWLGVLVFSIGVTVARSAPKRSLPTLLVVLYAAFSGQYIGNAAFGGLASALTGAMVMTLSAFLVSRIPTAMPPHASFLPGFWLLVPGAMGLIGLTRYVGVDGAVGTSDLLATVGAIFGVALGVLTGTLLWSWVVATDRIMGDMSAAYAERRTWMQQFHRRTNRDDERDGES